ncbi:MAG: four helix bundle protein [Longimicrobiales bacterium]|nr:four helix bundle protein [Longimicrobiales bacterium]
MSGSTREGRAARDERFAFKKLEVYRAAVGYYGWVLGVVDEAEKVDLPLADQARRQAQSIVHNTAEGAGHWQPGNKRKYYGIARASTFEAAAALDLLRVRGFITAEEFDEREQELAAIGASLTRLCQRYDSPSRTRR